MRVATAVLLLVLLAVPSAVAQFPQNPVCGPISVTQPAAPSAVRAGERTDIVVPVDNEGSVAATIEVTAQTSARGWTIVSSPAPASVAPGGTGQFTFALTPTADAEGDATVTFSASGACDSPLGAACGAACNAGSAVAQATVPLAAPEGFTIPGLENLNIPLEYLIAAILLVALASAIPFLMRRRRGGIVAQCPEPLKMVKPGRGTSFPIELRNAGKEAGVAHFEVGPVPEGWSAFMPLPEVQLAAREARSLWLMVRSPATATNGDAVDVELRLKDPRGADSGLVKVRAEVQGSAADN
jgi:hypothetical protein